MIHGVRYIRQDVNYISKKHSCPICNTSLSVVKNSKIINSNSEEAEKIPPITPRIVIGSRGVKFRNYTGVGNIKWVWKEFECPTCLRRFTVEQMKQIEAAPKECWEEMIASFDESPKQTDEKILEAESSQNTKKDSKKTWTLALCIAISIIVLAFLLVTVIILSTPKFVDTNGPDNFALTEITRDDILKSDNSYSSSMASESHSGFHSNIIGTRLLDCDYDKITRSFGEINGILTLQATKVSKNDLTLNINSSLESGNAEIVIVIDGEYYCSVEVNQSQSITLQDISNKEILVKLAGEAAKIKIDISRTYY